MTCRGDSTPARVRVLANTLKTLAVVVSCGVLLTFEAFAFIGEVENSTYRSLGAIWQGAACLMLGGLVLSIWTRGRVSLLLVVVGLVSLVATLGLATLGILELGR